MDLINRADINKKLLEMLTADLANGDNVGASIVAEIMTYVQDLPNADYPTITTPTWRPGERGNGIDFTYLDGLNGK